MDSASAEAKSLTVIVNSTYYRIDFEETKRKEEEMRLEHFLWTRNFSIYNKLLYNETGRKKKYS